MTLGLAFLAFALPALGGCAGKGEDGGAPGALRVVCTTAMVTDLARAVGGPRVEAVGLMGEGVDPHLYKTSPGDIALLEKADLVLYNGLHLEGKMGEVLERLARRKAVKAVTTGLSEDRILKAGGEQPDPHVWFDVALWSQGLNVVRDALAELDPEHRDEYAQRAADYLKTLTALDEEVKRTMNTLAPERRVLVTAHDAFHYFGRAYGMEVRAIQGISTESEASVREINNLVDFLSTRKIPAVFVESTVNGRNIQALVEGCKARGHNIRIGGELFSDAMGRADSPEGTYPGMVRHNAQTIVHALSSSGSESP